MRHPCGEPQQLHAVLPEPEVLVQNLINHFWVGWGSNSSFCTWSFSPYSPSLNTSSVGGGVTALVLAGPGACPLPLEDVLLRPLPWPLATAPLRVTVSVAGSDASCLAGVGVGAVVALVLTICEIE